MPSLALAKSRVLANVAGLTTTFFDLVREELFGAGEQGIYMPSVHESFLRGDLYQDAAGTTPVTAAGQPVGLWLDRSGNGKHASQPTAASRPTLQQDANGMYVLRFDGVDDWMVTPSIDFTGTDKMTVIAGVRRVIDALMCFVELGPITDTNNGTFTLFHPSTAGAALWSVRGTAMSSIQVPGAFPANTSCVYTGTADFAASGTPNASALRRDGSKIDSAAIRTPGAVSFSNWPIYIGRRAGTSFPVNGDIYGLIAVGAQKSLAVIDRAEALINKYTRSY